MTYYLQSGKMSQVLQVLEIFEIWICHIFELCWLPKLTSTISKQPMERDGSGNKNKVYVKIIDKSFVIVTARRKLDGFKW